MPKRRISGIDAPLVKGRIEYQVRISMPTEVWRGPPLATDVLDVRVNSPQSDVIEKVVDDIGDIILASQNFRHPNKAVVVETDVEGYSRPGGLVDEGDVHYIVKYVVEGTGMGEAAEQRINLRSAADMKRVLIDGDNEPIRNNTQIREFDTGPLEIKSVQITCD